MCSLDLSMIQKWFSLNRIKYWNWKQVNPAKHQATTWVFTIGKINRWYYPSLFRIDPCVWIWFKFIAPSSFHALTWFFMRSHPRWSLLVRPWYPGLDEALKPCERWQAFCQIRPLLHVGGRHALRAWGRKLKLYVSESCGTLSASCAFRSHPASSPRAPPTNHSFAFLLHTHVPHGLTCSHLLLCYWQSMTRSLTTPSTRSTLWRKSGRSCPTHNNDDHLIKQAAHALLWDASSTCKGSSVCECVRVCARMCVSAYAWSTAPRRSWIRAWRFPAHVRLGGILHSFWILLKQLYLSCSETCV